MAGGARIGPTICGENIVSTEAALLDPCRLARQVKEFAG
jgi:hypothetical protein